jgi:peptidoglycan/LPS O-acetylase OafA/YrhL
MTKKIEAIDFLKGYSILSIVIFHLFQSISLPPFIAKGIDFGGTGVHTFIFASGFGLYLSHLKKPLGFIPFLKKRFTKIYIPYILVVTLIALVSLFIPIYENSLYAFLGHVLLYKMFDNDIICSYGYQFWFISTILQFYLLFPLFVRARERFRDKPFLLLGLSISIAWGILLIATGRDFYRNWTSAFFTYTWEFCLGMLCAERLLRNGYKFWEIPKTTLLLLALGGIGLYGLLALKFGVYGRVLNDIPALFGYTSLALLLYRLDLPWINRFILTTEKISYPLFLIHLFILQLVLYFTSRAGLHFNGALLALTFILCWFASFPMQKILTRLTNILVPDAPVPAK